MRELFVFNSVSRRWGKFGSEETRLPLLYSHHFGWWRGKFEILGVEAQVNCAMRMRMTELHSKLAAVPVNGARLSRQLPVHTYIVQRNDGPIIVVVSK